MSDTELEADTDYEIKEQGDGLETLSEAEDQKADQPETRPLTIGILSECLSLLCKTGNALSLAFVKADLKEQGLTDINALRSFIHLRYVDVSGNFLRDITPLANLSHLLSLRADANLLTSPYLEELPFLQQASLAQNRLRDTEGITHPLLETLNLIGNQIREVTGLDPNKLSRLHTLELRGNALESTAGINLSNLQNLYLAGNSINRLEGLASLRNLQVLHLRDNHLDTLEGFSDQMVSLQYLNVRANLIVKIQEVKHLQCLPALRALIITENPCTEEDAYRLETLMLLPKLERLDKDGFTNEERTEAEDIQKRKQDDPAVKEDYET